MKKYFAKYLPVEGEIQKFSWVITPDGKAFQLGDNPVADNLKKKGWKVAKLFLCSRDIQVGDLLVYTGIPQGENEEVIAEIKYQHQLDFVKQLCKVNDTIPYKVIGEISPDALGYVREGQEYEREDWKYEENDRKNYNELNIKIKGPCGHFH